MTRSILLMCLVAGCFHSGEPGLTARYDDTEHAATRLDEGVVVRMLADEDLPVFYSEGYYWRYDGSDWYRSESAQDGWEPSRGAPAALRPIAQMWRGTQGSPLR
jgi:hypothetical protein